MTCRELIDVLDDYLTGELPAGERIVFDAHLATCAACIAYLRAYRDTVRVARAAAADDDETDAPAELIAAILAARGRSHP